MPVGIFFSKARAEELVSCLEHGKPITGVQSVNDMYALAGACFFLVMSQKGTQIYTDYHRWRIWAYIHPYIQIVYWLRFIKESELGRSRLIRVHPCP